MKHPGTAGIYVVFYKPYGVLSQFTSPDKRLSLKDFGPFPKGVYPVGRLDYDSEGLLLLTNDPIVNNRLSNPKYAHEKTYFVQVEGVPTPNAIDSLRKGILIQGRKTLPAEVRVLEHQPPLPQRPVPIRERKAIPTSWLEMRLREGRNRQVRRMTAAAGFPTLRLVRIRIAHLEVGSLNPGEHRSLTGTEISFLKKMR